MLIDPIYYAVFYDVAKPKHAGNAMNKRIDKKIFKNLVDDNGSKTVLLKDSSGTCTDYKIISVSTFTITNTVDNHLFAVCDCEKIV